MPCDYSKYPADWKERRARILARAGQQTDEAGKVVRQAHCEFCRAENAAIGYRDPITKDFVCAPGWLFAQRTGEAYKPYGGEFRLVLTIAHLDHDAENHEVADERLAALCQRCHLQYDAKHHAQNAAATRHNKAGLADLFASISPTKEGSQSHE